MSGATPALRVPMPRRRVHVPVVLQMEFVECGAAALAMVLASYGAWVPLEDLRTACAVSRDGSNAKNVALAAQRYGLTVKAYRYDLTDLADVPLPAILFWSFNHFVVLTGTSSSGIVINDPAAGVREVSWDEVNRSFTGITLTFAPQRGFVRRGHRPSVRGSMLPLVSGRGTR